jgi:hypothetical protein
MDLGPDEHKEGEASDSRNFETLLDIGPDLNPCAALGASASIQNQTARPRANVEYARQSRINPAPKPCPLLSENTLQSAGTN